MNMDLNNCWIANPEIIVEKEDDGILLFNPDTGEIKILNETGAFFYEHLDGEASVKDIVLAMCNFFDGISFAEAEKDTFELIKDLIANRLIARGI